MIGLAFIILVILGAIPLLYCFARTGGGQEPSHHAWVRASVIFGVVLGAVVFLMWFLSFYGEVLWFRELDYAERFWTVLWTEVGVFLAVVTVCAAFLVGMAVWSSQVAEVRDEREDRPGLVPALIAAGIASVFIAATSVPDWETVQLFIHGVKSEATDAIFGKPVSFYLFGLPFYSFLCSTGITVIVFAFILSAIVAFISGGFPEALEKQLQSQDPWDRGREVQRLVESFRPLLKPLLVLGALLFVFIAWNTWLDRYRLMYSTLGVVAGPGWTDVHIRLPALAVAMVAHLLVAAFLLGWAFLPDRLDDLFPGLRKVALLVAYVIVLFVGLNIAPWIGQMLVVRPNEISKEAPYIRHNIDATRKAFGLMKEQIEEREFPVSETLSRETLEVNDATIRNVRLWDWRALLSTLQQLQEIRIYYAFRDVDIDRYMLDGVYRQTMLAPRELDKNKLSAQADTWVNRHIKYTHGFGVTLNPVSEFQPNGEPVLLVKNIPPESSLPRVEISQPRIYYGNLTSDHVYVKTEEKEFDYPSGEQNVETLYEGDGGVLIGSSLLRRIVFAWKFDGNRLLFTGYLTPESRILFHRRVLDRLQLLAPFLIFDNDPYMVIDEQGRLKWICDAYTASDQYPYSEHYPGSAAPMRGANYVRNSVKAVVDAYDGSVQFYIFDPNDVMIRTYDAIFPGMFQPREEMPDDLEAHIRYPDDLFMVQAEMFTVYHMDNVTVFYNKEDVWSIANEKYRGNVQRVLPYYVILRLPQEQREEFVLMLPFTPLNKDVMMGWMAGRCDGEHYGKLIVYKFPKGKLTLGPMQVESKVDQDENMSRDLTLWDQRGSQVIRGNMLVIPIEDTILYVEPIYLQAETAKIPQLRKVVTAHWQTVVWANTLSDSLDALLAVKEGGAPPPIEGVAATVEPGERPEVEPGAEPGAEPGVAPPPTGTREELIREAQRQLEQWKRRTGQGDYQGAGEAMQRLQEILDELGPIETPGGEGAEENTAPEPPEPLPPGESPMDGQPPAE